MRTATPDEILGNARYAVVRIVCGKIAWPMETFYDEGPAEDYAEELRAALRKNYEAVRIVRGGSDQHHQTD